MPLARKLDLRTGLPVWSAYRAPAVPVAKLTRDIGTDVLIVGMGISGAMIAEALTARGRDVVCIDRRGPMKGSTAATTALVQFEIDQPLVKLSRMIGRSAAEQAWRRSRLSIVNLRDRIAELGIARGAASSKSLYLAGDLLDAAQLEEEAALRRRAGIAATFLPAAAVADRFGIDGRAAVLSHANLALDPRKLTAGLLLKALERGARFYGPAEATVIKDGALAVHVETRDGPAIKAQHLVLATGYELTDIVPATHHRIISTWAVTTRPQKRNLWPEQPFIWEASDPYLYLRATADGRVICGGEDEAFSDEQQRDALVEQKSARLAAKLGKLLPRLDTQPQFAWTGSFGTTTTGLPYIGQLPRHPRIHAVMGYGGNGITFSQIASELIASTLDGRDDADGQLFAFDR
jgi:glycine/D-amino acid oxidase-like deaminating enzyme